MCVCVCVRARAHASLWYAGTLNLSDRKQSHSAVLSGILFINIIIIIIVVVVVIKQRTNAFLSLHKSYCHAEIVVLFIALTVIYFLAYSIKITGGLPCPCQLIILVVQYPFFTFLL